ncbi:MAG: hypothetical protein ACLFVF_06005 [Thiohalospira sp.]
MAETAPGNPLSPGLVVAGRSLGIDEVCQQVNPLLESLHRQGACPAGVLGVVRVPEPESLVSGGELPLNGLSGAESVWYLCRLSPAVGTGDRATLGVILGLLPRQELRFAPALEEESLEPEADDWLLARLHHGLGDGLDAPVRWDPRHCRLLAEHSRGDTGRRQETR